MMGFFYHWVPDKYVASIRYTFYCLNIFLVAYVIFYFLTNFPLSTDHKRTIILVFSILIALSIRFSHISFDQSSRAIKILTRSVICIFLFYGLTAFPSILPESNDQKLVLRIFSILNWISILLGLFGIWRPTLAVPMLLMMIWQRTFTDFFYQVQLPYTDNLVISELGLLLIIGLVVLSHAKRLSHSSDIRDNFSETDDLVRKMPNPSEIFVLLTVSIHFTNYFNSAIKKLLIGPNWWSWTLDNPTQEIILAAKLQGNLPISHIHWLWTSVYEVISSNLLFFNFMTIFLQFIVIIAIFRIKWMLILTILYDVSHLIIFFVSGIFFWKWIFFNFAIVAALDTFRQKTLSFAIPVVMFFIITVGGNLMLVFPSLSSSVSLGWYETNQATLTEMWAVTDDDKRYRVPSNYFLRSSVAIAQDEFESASKINIGFPVYSQSIMHDQVAKTRDCAVMPIDVPERIYLSERERLKTFLTLHQKYILSIVDDDGYFNFDLYPHHIWSNPFEFTDFRELDKKRIVGFNITFRTICMKYVNEIIETEEIAKDNFYVPIAVH